MNKTYKITGMTCDACAVIVHDTLAAIKGVNKVAVELHEAQAHIEMENPIPLNILQHAFVNSLYGILETDSIENPATFSLDELSERNKKMVADFVAMVGRFKYGELQKYLHPDYEYNGGVHLKSGDAFVEMIKQHADSPAANVLSKFSIQAIYADDEECVLIYDAITRFPGLTVPFVEKIKIKEGKIGASEVRFNRARMKALMQEISKTKQ